jgi:NhaP-type Na+/H+ or K+/H+ antiporter
VQEHPLLPLAVIGGLSVVCQWVAWRLKLPAILFLLLAGIAVGPGTGLLSPDELFGDLLFPLVSMAVAIILFEGSMTLRFREVRGVERVILKLVSVGTLITWVIVAWATHAFVGLSWPLAILFGAVMTVTGPTVIVPMLRAVRPTQRIANVLRWEGILIDPIGAVLAVLVFEFIKGAAAGGGLAATAQALVQLVVVGTLIGAGAGYALGVALRRDWIPDFLHEVTTLGLVTLAFGIANALQEESGLLAVTVMGVWLANMRDVRIDEILHFKESLSILLISGLFILLAARIEFAALAQVGVGAVVLFAVMQFVARPLKVAASTVGSTLKWRERLMIAWIGPRGIVAAAISAIFALELEQQGYAESHLLVPLTFAIIIGTVVFQSATSKGLARLLKVAEPEPKGLLVVGANLVARAVAKALNQRGFTTLLCDASWENIRLARAEGLATYYGSPASEHADSYLDLVGLGRLLGLSPQPELNALTGMRFKREFGAANIFALQSETERNAPENLRVSRPHPGYELFGEDVTYSRLARMIGRGAEVRGTRLTEAFDFAALQAALGKDGLPLFAISPKGKLEAFVVDGELKPEADWVVLVLAPADLDLPAEEEPEDEARAESATARPPEA